MLKHKRKNFRRKLLKWWQYSYEVEMAVRDIVDDITTAYDLEPDFYGDCYPEALMVLESRMKYYDDIKYHEALKEARDILMEYIHGDD